MEGQKVEHFAKFRVKNEILKVWGPKTKFCESLGIKMIFYPKFYQIYILFKLKVYYNFYFNLLPLQKKKNSKCKISSNFKNFSQGVP